MKVRIIASFVLCCIHGTKMVPGVYQVFTEKLSTFIEWVNKCGNRKFYKQNNNKTFLQMIFILLLK